MWNHFRFLLVGDVEKSEFFHIWHVCDVENVSTYVQFILFCCKIGFVPIYALLSQNCFVVIYALLCGGKFNRKLPLWRRNDKYQVWWDVTLIRCTK